MKAWEALLGSAWLLLVAFGLTFLWNYANAPGVAAAAPPTWPAGSALSAPEGKTLLAFVHPRCPCSRATLRELDRLMTEAKDLLSARVLFYAPSEEPSTWVETDLWEHAARIPGVRVLRDVDGAETRRFGAATSGQVLLYDAGGALLFSGGITAARGHSGDNFGRSSLLEIVLGGDAERAETPVYGCPILNADECEACAEEPRP